MLTIETRQSKCYSFVVLEPLIFRQLGEDVDEIKRRVHREVYVLAGNRVHKSQRTRVEHRPRAVNLNLGQPPPISPPPPGPPVPDLIQDDDDHASTHQGVFLVLTMTALNFLL